MKRRQSREAQISAASGDGSTITLVLTDVGATDIDRLGEQQFHKQIAIVSNGLVVAAPTVQPEQQAFTSFGGTIGVNAPLSQSQADKLADMLNAHAK